MAEKDNRTRAKQTIEGSKIGGAVRQVNNAEVSEQSVSKTTAASAEQENRSEGGFNFGRSSARGKYGILALATLLAVVAIVGLLKFVL
jgi:hypothetical protein